jgi:hypothetical protein
MLDPNFLTYGQEIKQLFQSDAERRWKSHTEIVGTCTHVTNNILVLVPSSHHVRPKTMGSPFGANSDKMNENYIARVGTMIAQDAIYCYILCNNLCKSTFVKISLFTTLISQKNWDKFQDVKIITLRCRWYLPAKVWDEILSHFIRLCTERGDFCFNQLMSTPTYKNWPFLWSTQSFKHCVNVSFL